MSEILTGDEARYSNQNDATMRLTGSIIRYDGHPYFVKMVGSDLKALLWDMKQESPDITAHVNDPRLDVSSIPLGFINAQGTGIFLSRGPIRAQKQGVCFDYLKLFFLDPEIAAEKPVSNTSLLTSFRKAYDGEFPSLSDSKGLAFAKTWGLKPTRDSSLSILYHKRIPVGIYFEGENRFLFSKGELTPTRHRSLMSALSKKGLPGEYYTIQEVHD